MAEQNLSFSDLLGSLQAVIAAIEDPRASSNATKYSVADAVLGAFAMFFMQCESFLEHQRQMQSRRGKDNAQTLFGLVQIPTNNQIRNILDGIAAPLLFGVFEWVFQALRRTGQLQRYERINQTLLVGLDGTDYFSSQKLCCEQCSSRTHRNGSVTYFHSAILPVIVAPGNEAVIALAPEFITPQDGSEKQDCEQAAAKRWVRSHAAEFEPGSMGVCHLLERIDAVGLSSSLM